MENETREFIKAEIEGLAQIVKKGFDGVYEHFEDIDKRFDAVDERFESVDERFDTLEKRLSVKIDGVRNSLDAEVFRRTNEYGNHERRIARLEKSVLS